MKKLVSAVLMLCLLFGLTACSPLDNMTSRERIFRVVEKNEELLRSCIESGDFTPLNRILIIGDISVKDSCIDFDCGGAGFGSQTAYCGFYYTESNDMYAIWCAPPHGESLTQQGSGYYWEQQDGDNTYYTEKICDNFYYYKATF